MSLPFPDGWFAVLWSDELSAGAVRTVRFVGRDVVLFRTEAGEAVAVDAHCPHLGAHLGHGGCVRGETIACPFHDFRFDARGSCVATGYGTRPPPKAKLRTWPLREIDGAIVLFHHHDAEQHAAPSWEPPAYAASGYGPARRHLWTLRGHPQETSENSADLGHLKVVHGYEELELRGLETEGPYFGPRVSFTRPAGLFGRGDRLRANIDIHVHGLGWSVVHTEVPSHGIVTRQWVLSTPTEVDRIELRVALRLQDGLDRGRVHPLFRLLPNGLVTKLLRALAFRGFLHDVEQDFEIWNHKTYVSPPILAEGDGPIGAYRKWARQFYAAAAEPRVTALPVLQEAGE